MEHQQRAYMVEIRFLADIAFAATVAIAIATAYGFWMAVTWLMSIGGNLPHRP